MPQNADPPDDAPWPLAPSSNGSPTATASPSLTSNLAQAIGYSLDTLATNRAGQISEGQISDLKAAAARAVWSTLLQAGVFLLFAGVTSQMRVVRTRTGDVPVPPGGWPVTAVLLILVVIVCVSMLPAVLKWLDVHSMRAVAAEGLVTRDRRKASSYFRVNNLSFRVPAEAYDALDDGPIYRVYYTPRSKTFLSIEPI